MNNYIKVDVGRINSLINGLKMSNKEAKRAIKGGLRKSAQVIQKQARLNLKSVRNEATGKVLDSKNLIQFVRISVYKNAQGARVDVMDDKRKSTNTRLQRKGMTNKSFILKFFATGTDDRYTKNRKRSVSDKILGKNKRGGYRGRIGNSQFFKMAVESKQKEAEGVLEDSIVEYINKVVSRRK